MIDRPTGRGLAHMGRALGQRALPAIGTWLLAVGPVVAHSDHTAGHDGGGWVVVPAGILVGGLAVIGAGAYLDHTDGVDGRLARLAILFGIGGVLVGVLAGL